MQQTFRPRSNYAWAGTSLVLLTLFVANSILVVGVGLQTVAELMVAGVLSGVVYAIWLKPKLVLRDEVIEVVNPLRTELIPYNEVIDLETKWALTIVHNKGKTTVWVAPASGKRRWIADQTFGWYGRGVPLSDSRATGSETMSESLNSLSGQAAYLIRERLKRLH